MLTAGAYARPGVRHRLALDLGTSTVRLWTSATGEVLSEPAVLCRPGAALRRPDAALSHPDATVFSRPDAAVFSRPDAAASPRPDAAVFSRPGAVGPGDVLYRLGSGRHVAGRAALAVRGASVARTWPVRDGVVRDFFACVHLLRLLAAQIGLSPDDAAAVLVGVPATATLRQRNVLVAAVRRALGGRVVPIEEPLAAALACRSDPGCDDLIVVDIGSGRIEVARIQDRSVTAAERVEDADPVDPLPAVAECVRRLDVRRSGLHRPDLGRSDLHRPDLGLPDLSPSDVHRPDVRRSAGSGGRRRLIVTGGGAAAPGTAARLAALTGLSVTVPADPPMATLTGLRRLLID